MMHHALQIQEILLNIFGHCHPPSTEGDGSDLPALARTCHAFKEPALDVLWRTLPDLSPLAQCLPETSHHRQISRLGNKCYSFSRSLTQTEWGILRSYTRRVRSIWDNARGLDWESVGTFLLSTATEPLFPNLRHLYCGSATESKHLLYMPFPSIITLSIGFRHNENLKMLQGSFESFSKFSLNIRRLSIRLERSGTPFSNFLSSCMCQWRNLQAVDCGSISLNVDALAHLSRMSALTQLTFTLSAALPDQITSSNSALVFSNLREFTLYSEVLDSISRFLSRTRLPSVIDFSVFTHSCPSKLDTSSFLANVQTSGIGYTVQGLLLEQSFPTDSDHVAKDPRPVLGCEDLQPCMAFSSLRRITFNIEWNVELTSGELLALASAWPRLEGLAINADWGWNTPGGITPNGLLQLLQTCRFLNWITLAIDTQGYTTFHQSSASLGLTLPPTFSINVVDSIIEPESVPAVAAFLANIALRSDFSFRAWDGWVMEDMGCKDLWYQAYRRANDSISRILGSFGYHLSRSDDI